MEGKRIRQPEMYILVNLHRHSWKRRDDVGETRNADYDEEEAAETEAAD